MKTKYNVKLLNGSKQEVTYSGVETVTLPDADSSGVKKFTAGEPLDDFTVTPDFSGGDQTVEAPEGYVVRSATVLKPDAAEVKIAKGETLMGMTGEYVTPGTSKTVELDFKNGLVVDNLEDVSALLGDRGNVGKYVKYMGETGEYTSGQFYKVIDEYAAFEPDSCPSVAAQVESGTALTVTLEGCKVGDLVVATFAIRSDLVTLNDGWTLISTSQSVSEINSSNTTNQTLSFAYKYATSTTEELTVTQTTAARIYINIVALSGVSGFTDAGYQYQNNASTDDTTNATFIRPNGRLIIWGATRTRWTDVTNGTTNIWEMSNGSYLIQLGSTTPSRLLLAIDTSEYESVTFATEIKSAEDAYICGALSVELAPQLYLVEADSSEIPCTDAQIVSAEGDERWNEVVINKPENLTPENIAKGVEIAGVVGGLEAVTMQAVAERTLSGTVTGDAITSVGSYAFMGTEIEAVSLSNCITVGSAAFCNCVSLSKVYLPNVSTVKGSVFSGAVNLKEVLLGCNSEFYASVGNYAFQNCSLLEAVSFQYSGSVVDGMVYLGAHTGESDLGGAAFLGCSNLKSIHLIGKGDGAVTGGTYCAIPPRAFMNCNNLSSVSITGLLGGAHASQSTLLNYPDVGVYAFANCSNLSSITLRLSGGFGIAIGSSAFENCVKLQHLWLYVANTPSSGSSWCSLGSNAFNNTPLSNSTLTGTYGSIHVPSAIYSMLRVANGWKSYSYRMVSY